jgi:CheY-like chemotaxis protein
MPKKILVVEDDITMRETLTALLRLEGFDVITACDGEEGYNLARVHLPHLIITDLHMPILDGVTLARKLRGEQGTLAQSPILALSANISDYNLPERMNSGITRFFDKASHDGQGLVAAVQSMLESAPAELVAA